MVSLDLHLTKAKISNPDIPLEVNQHIFWLKVPVDDIFGMEELESQYDLRGIEESVVFGKFIFIL